MVFTKNISSYIFLLFCCASCSYFQPKDNRKVVASVGNHNLYEEDIKDILGENYSKEDSVNIVSSYINSWAIKRMLIDKAEVNLSEIKQHEFNKLVEEYKIDLYSNAYREALVNKSLDTTITEAELRSYYNDNKDNFKLNEDLLKLRYIGLPPNFSDAGKIKKAFEKFDEDDKKMLKSRALQFKSYSLNDSTWVKTKQVIEHIPPLNGENKDEYLKKSKMFELNDSLGIYLVFVKDIRQREEIAPLMYVKPTVRQIILNKRKLEFIRNLEKDLLKEGLENKQFKIYE
ncbi:peptidyl-prolyl cis-trans isomerase [Zhouia sp. PK063]|uniref:peptidyl-prolyl cis-trans isomerase n=1 Tax=Zhouia sp. PK063 TaxID=3373602 RepID=UPI0037BDF64E